MEFSQVMNCTLVLILLFETDSAQLEKVGKLSVQPNRQTVTCSVRENRFFPRHVHAVSNNAVGETGSITQE